MTTEPKLLNVAALARGPRPVAIDIAALIRQPARAIVAGRRTSRSARVGDGRSPTVLGAAPGVRKIRPAVFGGSPVDRSDEERLGLVSISHTPQPGHRDLGYTCSGVLVGARWILTVQHCIASGYVDPLPLDPSAPQPVLRGFISGVSHRARFLDRVQLIDRFLRIGPKLALVHVPDEFDPTRRSYAQVSVFGVDALTADGAGGFPVTTYGIGYNSLGMAQAELGAWRRGDYSLATRDSPEARQFHADVAAINAMNPRPEHAETSDRGLVFSEATAMPQALGGDSGGPWFLSDGTNPTDQLVGMTEAYGQLMDGRYYSAIAEVLPVKTLIDFLVDRDRRAANGITRRDAVGADPRHLFGRFGR